MSWPTFGRSQSKFAGAPAKPGTQPSCSLAGPGVSFAGARVLAEAARQFVHREGEDTRAMNVRKIRLRDWARLIYYLSQNTLSLTGVVLTTSSAITLIGFWIYDFILPGPPHPYVGILIFLLLPGVFLLGLILMPIGILSSTPEIAGCGRVTVDLSSHRPEDVRGAQRTHVCRPGHVAQLDDFWICVLPRRVLHGHDHVLRADLPHRDGAGVQCLSRFAALARGVRRMPYRPRSRLVRQVQAFRIAPGLSRSPLRPTRVRFLRR